MASRRDDYNAFLTEDAKRELNEVVEDVGKCIDCVNLEMSEDGENWSCPYWLACDMTEIDEEKPLSRQPVS